MKYDKLNHVIYLPSNIAFLRNVNNLSQNGLAKKLKYKSGSTITNWENGIRLPDVFDLWRLAQIFNVSVDDLIKVDLRLNDPNYLDNVVKNIKTLDKSQQNEIIQVIDVLVKSKLTNLSGDENE